MVETRSLRYQYPGGPALSFDDLDVPQGATVLLHGNSGAGKSTWLALAAGLLTPSAGAVMIGGQALSQLSRAARDAWRGRYLGFLPQKLHLSDALSVERNLALAYYAAGVPENRSRVQQALDRLGVGELATRRPSQLSGGQAQRVALARTILMEPKVILADEPTASLDDQAALTGISLLEECAVQCNATLVIATHDRRVQEALPAALVHRIGQWRGVPDDAAAS
jgi:putative ABC transport system ATP-binding protein